MSNSHIFGILLACRQPEQRDQTGRMMDLLMEGLRRESGRPAHDGAASQAIGRPPAPRERQISGCARDLLP